MSRNPTDDNTALWSATLNAFASRQAGLAILSGCSVSKGSGDFDSDISSGTVWLNGSRVSVSSATKTHTDTNNLSSGETRVDLLSVDSGGSISITKGTGATNPTAPDIPSDEVLLGYWQISGDDSTLSSSDLFDLPALALEIEDLTSGAAASGVPVVQTDGSIAMAQGDSSAIDADTVRGLAPGGVVSRYGRYSVALTTFDQSVTISNQSHRAITTDNDGGKFFTVDSTDGKIYEWDAPTKFDLSRASQSQSIDTKSAAPEGMAWNDDGSKLYDIGTTDNKFYEFELSTNFDISTATFKRSKSAQGDTNTDMAWNDDGSKLYSCDDDNSASSKIYEYDVSTAYDVTTASSSTNISSQDTSPNGITWNEGGTKLYEAGLTNGTWYEYDVSTAYDISTASFTRSVSSQDSSPTGIAWGANGTLLYEPAIGDTIYIHKVGVVIDEDYHKVPVLANDPDSPPDGSMWYRSDNNRYRGVEDGTVVKFDTTDA